LLNIAEVPSSFIFDNDCLKLDSCCTLLSQYPFKTVVVPSIKGSLRIKVLSEEEFDSLPPPCDQSDKFVVGNFHYCFALEEEHLENTPGVLVSLWKQDDPAVTSTLFHYDYCRCLYEVYKTGFGARCTAACTGLNAYRAARNSSRAHPTPAVGVEQIAKQQYYRAEQSFPFSQALLEKSLHHITNEIVGSAKKSNPSLMKLLGEYCQKTILTCGIPPSYTKEGTQNCPTVDNKKNATFGFKNDLHLDLCDKLSRDLQQHFSSIASETTSLCRLSNCYGLGLPTTCGYQFIFNTENPLANQQLVPYQYFSMDGLGLLVKIEHGFSNHFLAWTFSHRTTSCWLHDTIRDLIYLNNKNDLFMVLAWGRAGGTKEVKAAQERLNEKEKE
jgi:hypothetical protein